MNMENNTISCPVCYSEKYSLSHLIRNYRYRLCSSCGMLYINNSEANSKQYDENYFAGSVKENMSGYVDYALQSRPLRMNFRNLLRRILPYIIDDQNASMLDVGCAYGFFLDEAKKVGMSVHGIDVSESAVKWMRENLGIDGTVGISSNAPDGPFDLITAIEVIEHTSNPHAFLDDLYKRLNKKGVLVIVTGYNDACIARWLGKKWWYLNPPDHCSIFSREALRKIISDKGFNVLEHSIIPFHWVGINNMLLKVARILESKHLARFASKLPVITVPIFHFSTQFIIAEKC